MQHGAMCLTQFRKSLLLLLTGVLWSLGYSSAWAQGALAIKINPVFNGKPLILRNKMYATATGDSVSIDVFKWYMSALSLSMKKKMVTEPNSYHLINADDSSSLIFKWENLPEGSYEMLSFCIGVDSEASVSGALGGALDPALGMYWAWNTGYIDAKLTGYSPACATLHHQFEFHIGGYKEPYITLRKVSLPLSSCSISKGKTTQLVLNADVASWFTGIHLAVTNQVVLPSVEALRIADNYMEMFSNNNLTDAKKK